MTEDWHGKKPRPPERPTNPPACIHCSTRIVGIPDGWKHVADNRQYGDDGHEAEPRVIA